MHSAPKGKLFVVATPIGNLKDITLRALDVLKAADVIACEDTRQTQKLLVHYNIQPAQIVSVHKFNERARTEKIIGLLEAGKNVALVSDAGTPALSDPGADIAAAAAQRGIVLEPVPGPSALCAALSVCGLAADQFVFDGFLPRKGKDRRRRLEELKNECRTLVFFETPHRIMASLQDVLNVLGDRRAVMARELTKIFEQICRARVSQLIGQIGQQERVRGEIVLIVEGNTGGAGGKQTPSADQMNQMIQKYMADQKISRKEAMRNVARQFGISRRDVYRAVLDRDDKS